MIINRFYNKYYWLSNFYLVWLEYEGLIYPSVENAYQAAKTNHIEYKQRIQTLTPAAAKKFGKSIKVKYDWKKLEVMEELIRKKFLIPEFKEKLLATGDAELIEGNWWGDTFWGVCNGIGENHLGKIIMKVRKDIILIDKG